MGRERSGRLGANFGAGGFGALSGATRRLDDLSLGRIDARPGLATGASGATGVFECFLFWVGHGLAVGSAAVVAVRDRWVSTFGIFIKNVSI